MPFIVPSLASKFEIYCASIVSSKRAFFEFIVPVIVPPLASKFEFYCASIASSRKAIFEFVVPVIVSTILSKFELYCVYYTIKIRNLLCLSCV